MSAFLRFWFAIGDLVFLNLSILSSLYFYGGGFWMDAGVNNVYLILFSNASWIFLVMVSNPYNVTKGWSLSKLVKSQLAFVFIHLLMVACLILFFKQRYSMFQVSLIYLIFIPTFILYRIITFYVRKVFTDEVAIKNYVLVGRNSLSSEIRKFYLMNPDSGYKFLGYLDFGPDGFSITNIREFCVERDVHEIYCCIPEVSGIDLQQLVNFGLDSLIKVKVIASPGSSQQSIQLEKYDSLPGIDLATIKLDEVRFQLAKRLFDLAFSSVFCLLVMSWLVPLIGLLIKLDSKGPVFFVQMRSGKQNMPFKCLKFRTMIVNVDSETRQASRNDNRITKLGHFLRKTSIDELPQFMNVFVGSMSVVGPRPHMLRHTEDYRKLIDKFLGRHYVKPGITGLAQCMGYRGETRNLSDMENRVRLDRYYIENWTFWLDIKIIFLTIVSLIRGSDKAY
jgi:putative colanic acid biosynthesis UDP-glucose lipid carrier transferase